MKKIYEMQKKLDINISGIHNITYETVNVERIIATIVEISEFANEIKTFKYWKKQKNINNKKVIEEFVDGIHFFATFAIQLNASYNIQPKIYSKNINKQLLEVFLQTSLLRDNMSRKKVELVFSLYLGLAKLIGIKEIEIEKAYFEKNKINFDRLANGY